MLIFMINSKPKITFSYSVIYLGMLHALFAISIYWIMRALSHYPDLVFENPFKVLGFLFTFLYALFILVACYINRHDFSKIVNRYIFFFITLDLLLIILQIRYKTVVFSSVTYVFPLTIYYILFHSNPYTDSNGCQNASAFIHEEFLYIHDVCSS